MRQTRVLITTLNPATAIIDAQKVSAKSTMNNPTMIINQIVIKGKQVLGFPIRHNKRTSERTRNEVLILGFQELRLINEELGHLRGLVKEGYAPRNRQLEMERMVADASTAIADLQGSSERARRTVAELRQRALSRQQEYRKEVETQLADVGREVLAENEKLHAVTNDLDRTEIKAPADGQVVGLVGLGLGLFHRLGVW